MLSESSQQKNVILCFQSLLRAFKNQKESFSPLQKFLLVAIQCFDTKKTEFRLVSWGLPPKWGTSLYVDFLQHFLYTCPIDLGFFLSDNIFSGNNRPAKLSSYADQKLDKAGGKPSIENCVKRFHQPKLAVFGSALSVRAKMVHGRRGAANWFSTMTWFETSLQVLIWSCSIYKK